MKREHDAIGYREFRLKDITTKREKNGVPIDSGQQQHEFNISFRTIMGNKNANQRRNRAWS